MEAYCGYFALIFLANSSGVICEVSAILLQDAERIWSRLIGFSLLLLALLRLGFHPEVISILALNTLDVLAQDSNFVMCGLHHLLPLPRRQRHSSQIPAVGIKVTFHAAKPRCRLLGLFP